MNGGGSSSTKEKTELPNEIKPLVNSAVPQIQAVQNALPLVNFTGYQPQGVPGTSTLQQFTMEKLLPGTLDLPSGIQQVYGMPNAIGQLSSGAVETGRPTNAAQSALGMLSTRLGGPTQLPMPSFDMARFNASLPQNAAPSNAFSSGANGLSQSDIRTMIDNLARQSNIPDVNWMTPPASVPIPATPPAAPGGGPSAPTTPLGVPPRVLGQADPFAGITPVPSYSGLIGIPQGGMQNLTLNHIPKAAYDLAQQSGLGYADAVNALGYLYNPETGAWQAQQTYTPVD